tara:strand:+ start:349 stop:1497 length:1149 start_codon:yes stop_codon:yes gene_type:complete
MKIPKMNNSNKLNYITYQTFPAETANSLQSMTMIKYFIKNGLDVKLIFPNRDKNSKSNLSFLKSFYAIDDNFEVKMTKHLLPFGKINFLNKFFFHFSHLLWSFFITRNINEKNELYFTRSDWVYYFLNKRGFKVIFEIHQYSKVRQFVLKNSKGKSSIYVFTTELLKNSFFLDKQKKDKSIVLHNGYDEELLSQNIEKQNRRIIFVGSLIRFNKERDISFFIEAFKSEKLKKFSLYIVGGPENIVLKYKDILEESKIENVFFLGFKNRKDAILEMQKSEFGILYNEKSVHALNHTSPLKYFEYIGAELKIISVDYLAHRELPGSDNLYYFDENDSNTFIEQILTANKEPVSSRNKKSFGVDQRVKKLLQFVARLEGFEPPTP